QFAGGVGAAESGHVLDAEQGGSGGFQLAGQTHIVVQVVLGTRRIEDIARIAEGGLGDHARLSYRLDGRQHGGNVVERIEDTEEVNAVPGRDANKLLHDVIG